ncbi:hypothetical protein ACTXT7_007808 [Hymenolepis weldensis]
MWENAARAKVALTLEEERLGNSICLCGHGYVRNGLLPDSSLTAAVPRLQSKALGSLEAP